MQKTTAMPTTIDITTNVIDKLIEKIGRHDHTTTDANKLRDAHEFMTEMNRQNNGGSDQSPAIMFSEAINALKRSPHNWATMQNIGW